jgi:hypothetical protein
MKVIKSNIAEMIKTANTILNHINDILLHIKTNITNGRIEGMNSKLRGFTKRAFKFKILKNLKITILYFFGKFNHLNLITSLAAGKPALYKYKKLLVKQKLKWIKENNMKKNKKELNYY